MIGSVPIIWAMWKTRNKFYFQRIGPGDPNNVVLLMCHFFHIWAKPKKCWFRKILLLARLAQEIIEQKHGWNPIERFVCEVLMLVTVTFACLDLLILL